MPDTLRLQKTLNAGVQYRTATLDTRAVDKDKRTIDLAFSSETPIERFFGDEILDHGKKSVRLQRLKASGPLLLNHRSDEHIGVVEHVSIDADRIGRATVRFGTGPRAEEIFQDVVEGIRKSVSVMYRIYKAVAEKAGKDKEIELFRITDWEPMEISIVSIPADISVGVGRAAGGSNSNTLEIYSTDEGHDMADNDTQVSGGEGNRGEGNQADGGGAIDVAAIEKGARETEVKRAQAIYALGDKHNMRELAVKFVEQGKHVDEMREAILDAIEDNPMPTGERAASDLDLSASDKQRYSLLTAIRASVNGDWSKAKFELECSDAIAERVQREARGFFVPSEIQTEKRVMLQGAVGGGGELVGTEHMAEEFIDRLKALTVLGRLNARILTGLVGNIDIPRLEAGATFFWLDQDEDVSDSDLGTGSVAMSPKTVAGSVAMSRRLLKQSSPQVEGLVRADLESGAALAIDRAGLIGGGANEPNGIQQSTGVNVQPVAAAGQPTFKEVVGFETEIDDENALQESLGYVTTPRVKGHLKTTPRDAGSGIMLAEGNQTNGYRLESTTQLPADTIMFGNFRDVIIGYWGVLDVMPDQAAKAASAGLVLRVFQDCDIAVRRPISFCINA